MPGPLPPPLGEVFGGGKLPSVADRENGDLIELYPVDDAVVALDHLPNLFAP